MNIRPQNTHHIKIPGVLFHPHRSHENDLTKASSPYVGAGRRSLGFCIPFSPHFVPAGAERRRPSMVRHTDRGRQIKEMEHFHTGGLDLLWGKGWQSLEKTLGLKYCQRCLSPPPSSPCSIKPNLFQISEPPSKLDKSIHYLQNKTPN